MGISGTRPTRHAGSGGTWTATLPANVSSRSRKQSQLLRREILNAGSQAEWARQNAVNRTYLNKVMNCQKPAGPAILDALKIEKVTVYLTLGADASPNRSGANSQTGTT